MSNNEYLKLIEKLCGYKDTYCIISYDSRHSSWFYISDNGVEARKDGWLVEVSDLLEDDLKPTSEDLRWFKENFGYDYFLDSKGNLIDFYKDMVM